MQKLSHSNPLGKDENIPFGATQKGYFIAHLLGTVLSPLESLDKLQQALFNLLPLRSEVDACDADRVVLQLDLI